MTSRCQFFITLLFSLVLASCASVTEQGDAGATSDTAVPGSYKYEAWQLSTEHRFAAINVLLEEADVLIENQAYDAAADKIERVLRIMPDYAPAWSRLSWLSLQMDAPKRSVQMAKRSNSFAHSDPALQSLNWRFIRSASKALHDEDAYHRANQKIDSLKAF